MLHVYTTEFRGRGDMDTNVRSAAGPATITWSGRITSAIEPGERLAVRCVDLHWSVIEQAEPASLPWGTVRHRSRSTSTHRSD